MKLHPRFLINLLLFASFISCLEGAAFSLVPQFVTRPVNKFLIREEIAALTPEQQQNGWLLDQLEARIVSLKKSDAVERITENPQTCWDLLVPEPATVPMQELDSQLKECNNATSVNEWHNKLDNLQTLVHNIKHPDSHLFYDILDEAKKSPLKKFLRIRYVVPVLTAFGVVGYMVFKKLGIPSLFYDTINNEQEESLQKVGPQLDTGFMQKLADGKIKVESLPAKTVIVRNNFTPDNIKKTVHLEDPIFGTIFKTIHEMPDMLNVTIDGQAVIEKNEIKTNQIKVVIPAGRESVPLVIQYDFIWNNKKKFEKYHSVAGLIKWALSKCGINRELLDEVVYGNKAVTYNLRHKFNEVTVCMAGWAGKGHRLKTDGDPNPAPAFAAIKIPREDLFQIEGVQKIADEIIHKEIKIEGEKKPVRSPSPDRLFET